MFIRHLVLSALCALICFSTCNAATYKISPVKMEAQNALLIQGETLLISQKQHEVVLYPTLKVLKNGNCGFYFTCSNQSDSPFNLYFQNLSVTDQWGRPIRIVTKEELIANKKTKARWKQFASALCTGLESCNAQDAGDITYQTNSSSDTYFNGTSIGSDGWIHSNENVHSSSSTNGIIHCEALKREALRQVELEGQARNLAITSEFTEYKHRMNHSYFDSNTLFPNTRYEGIFQISIPKRIQNHLEYLFVNLDVDGERHTFCFYCANASKNRR